MSANELDVLGPVDYLVVEFPADKANFTGEIAAELGSLIEGGTVRVLDLVILRKDEDGSVEAIELADVDESLAGALLELDGRPGAAAGDRGPRGGRGGDRTGHRRRGARLGEQLGGPFGAAVGARAASWSPTAASTRRRCWRLPRPRKVPDMLGRERRNDRGVIDHKVVRNAAGSVGGAAVAVHGHRLGATTAATIAGTTAGTTAACAGRPLPRSSGA